MPTSIYFKNTRITAENRLLEDIFVESIKIFGTEAFYIPRDDSQVDLVYGEDPLKTFIESYAIEIYNSDTTDYEGQKEMFSKFGIDIKNDYTVLMSRKTWKQRVPQNPLYLRPREGDLIYIPHVSLGGTLFEITWVEPDKDMFIGGRKWPYYYEMKLEPFKYSDEIINTGNEDIDEVDNQDSYTLTFSVATGLGNYNDRETVFQGVNLASATAHAIVSDWNAPARILSVVNISGEFLVNQSILGAISGTNRVLVSFDPLQKNLEREVFDNETIQFEGLTNMDTSENNPLGSF